MTVDLRLGTVSHRNTHYATTWVTDMRTGLPHVNGRSARAKLAREDREVRDDMLAKRYGMTDRAWRVSYRRFLFSLRKLERWTQ